MLRFPPTLRTHLLLAVVFVSILTVVQPRTEAFPNCPGGCFRGFWLGFPVVEGGGGINGFILDIPPYSERHFVGSSTVGTQFGAFDFEFAGTNAESGRVNIVGSGRHGMIQIFGDFTEGVGSNQLVGELRLFLDNGLRLHAPILMYTNFSD
jgi:hypothetical protein